ncbi:MAG: DUF4129 domain-containing protein [Methanomassiliicoccales archaeon]
MIEDPSTKHLGFVFALTAIALITTGLLVSNIQIADIGAGGESIRTFTNRIAEVMTTSLYILWAAVFIYIMFGFANSRRKGRKEVAASPSNWRGPLLGLFILAIWIVLINWSGLKFSFLSNNEGMQSSGTPGEGSVLSSNGGSGSSGPFVFIFLAILAVSLVAVYFIHLRRPSEYTYRYQVGKQGGQTGINLIDRAMEELYQGNDFRSIIIRMYQHMCRLVSDGERSDGKFLTPREFAALATEKLGWPEGPVKELTSLFEEARYSLHDIDETKKETASRCLDDIRTAIDRGSDEVDIGGIASADG